jgi:hypothetical protein
MKISKIEEAEEIVLKNKSLFWDGWDIIHYKKIEDGFTDSKSVYKENSWYKKEIFFLNKDGWNIPDRLIK